MFHPQLRLFPDGIDHIHRNVPKNVKAIRLLLFDQLTALAPTVHSTYKT